MLKLKPSAREQIEQIEQIEQVSAVPPTYGSDSMYYKPALTFRSLLSPSLNLPVTHTQIERRGGGGGDGERGREI